MALKKKVGPAGGPIAPKPLRPNVNKQVIAPHINITTPGAPARPAADNGVVQPRPSGHKPATGSGRPT